MKVHIDKDVCAGFGFCLDLAPEVFELNDDGYAVVLSADVPVDKEEAVRTAVMQCPSSAISITENN